MNSIMRLVIPEIHHNPESHHKVIRSEWKQSVNFFSPEPIRFIHSLRLKAQNTLFKFEKFMQLSATASGHL